LLGLAAETVEEEVEEIEHHLRSQTLKVLGKLVSYWKANPERLQEFLRFARKGAAKEEDSVKHPEPSPDSRVS